MRPTSPWRTGPASGARERVDTLYHSDSLYSAITNTLRLLSPSGLADWLSATAQNPAGSAVRFSSVFPLFTEHLLVAPTAWMDNVAKQTAGRRVTFLGHYAPLGLDYYWISSLSSQP